MSGKERVYVRRTTSASEAGEIPCYEIRYYNGNGDDCKMAECWDEYLSEFISRTVAERMVSKDGCGDDIRFMKAEGDRPEGWYRI